ncbi:hypothetical protein MLD38_016906 [Melastoma candidum]|uniref:Uncharacterized protein n=1 Tax=Melastoma candidum TaxID=119954 RepID=A0ACB9QNT8_9MYRT|nr:hypothetical protein MLD38_016906 [Melastoma candidum]
MAAKIEVDSTMKIDSSPSMERGRGSGTVANGARSRWESEGKTEQQRSIGAPEVENQREEKFQIDLMAPPPTRSSPGRDGHGDSPAGADQISNGTAGEEGEKRRTEAKKNKEGGVNAGKEEEVVVVVRREAEGDGKKSAGGGDSREWWICRLIWKVVVVWWWGMMMMMMGNGSAGVVSKRNHPPFPKQQQPAADKSAPPAGPLTFPIPVAAGRVVFLPWAISRLCLVSFPWMGVP